MMQASLKHIQRHCVTAPRGGQANKMIAATTILPSHLNVVEASLYIPNTISIRSFAKKKKEQPQKKKHVYDPDAKVMGTRDNKLEMILAALDAPLLKEPPISQEEKDRRERVAKAYTIGCFKQHNAFHHDYVCKIMIKKHALKMLPPHLKESALKEYTVEEQFAGEEPAYMEPPGPRLMPGMWEEAYPRIEEEEQVD